MLRATNPVISTYRSHQSVETLIRVHNVTGTEFPVSGDAPLRASWERLDGPAQLQKVDARPVQRYRNPSAVRANHADFCNKEHAPGKTPCARIAQSPGRGPAAC